VFEGWDNYFVMTGTASAGLIGLLFVVVTLTSNFERERALRGSAIYLTPTMTHFAVVLTASAIVLAPRLPPALTASLLGGAGVVGLGNAVRTAVGILELGKGADPPHWTDLWCYAVLPGAVYVGLEGAVAGLMAGGGWAPGAVAALLLATLLIAIRNAWDLITWMAPQGAKPPG
jgi:hypothetical protein